MANNKHLKLIHVSAWPQLFTHFRMPMIRRQKEAYKKLVIYCPDREYEGRGGQLDKLKKEGFELIIANISPKIKIQIPLQIFKLYKHLRKNKYHVLIAHQPMGALIGLIAGLFAKTPVRIYSTGGLKYVPDKKGLFNKIIKHGELVMIKIAHGTLLVNREDELILRSNNKIKNKCFYVGPKGGCGVDINKFNSTKRYKFRNNIRNILNIDDDTLVIGYTGRYVWGKGLREIIDTAVILNNSGNNIKYLFLGFGSGSDINEFNDEARRAGISKLIRFEGFYDKVERYMSAFDMFILLSYREGLSVSLLEAMAYGLPVIVTNIRGNRDLVNDGTTGLIVPTKKPESVANAIEKLRKDPELMKAISCNAEKEIQSKYSEESLVNKTMSLIDRLINERKKEFNSFN